MATSSLGGTAALVTDAVVRLAEPVVEDGKALARWVCTNHFARRRRRLEREKADVAVFTALRPVIQDYHRRLAAHGAPKPAPAAVLWTDPDVCPYVDDPNRDALERIEQAMLEVLAQDNWELRDMLENVVLYPNYRNEYYLSCLDYRLEKAVAARGGSQAA